MTAQTARRVADDWPETRSEWGGYAQRVCARVLDAWQVLDESERTEQRLRAMLRDAYPFGERAHHPYQMWLKQQQVALWRTGFEPMPAWVQRQQRMPTPPPKEQMRMEIGGSDDGPGMAG